MNERDASRHFTRNSSMSVVVEPPSPHLIRLRDVAIPMDDGVELSSNVYLPMGDGPFPVIMALTIYRKEEHASHYSQFTAFPLTHLGVMRFSEDATFEGPDPAFWTAYGYAVVHVDARGFGKSPGVPSPFSMQAARDYYAAIEWAAHQPWCTGAVGLSGVSYLGISQYFAAGLNPPSLRAINPWDARTDRFRSDFLGGIPNTVMSKYIFENFTIPSLNDPNYAEVLRLRADTVSAPRFISDPAYGDQRQILENITKIKVPTLIGGSVSDQAKHSRDACENYMNIPASTPKWLLMHREPEWAAYYDPAGLALQRRFFDHFLRDIDNGWDCEPGVIVHLHETRSRRLTRAFSAWPIPEIEYQDFYLSSGSRLGPVREDVESEAAYASDGGEIYFDLAIDEHVDLVGHARLKVAISIEDGRDADIFVGIKKFDKNGDEVFFLGESGNNPNDIVSRGWLRASHRELSPRTTHFRPVLAHERALPVIAHEIIEADIEIHPFAVSFSPGETLRLIVSGSSIQPTDVAIGFGEKVNVGAHRLHFGGRHDSFLRIPVCS